jgi:ubiquitin
MCMAVLEAALAAGHPLAPRIREVLEKEALALAERKKREAALIDRTRVNFETMEG